MKEYLVIDNGGTFIKYALMNEAAEILEQDKVPTPQGNQLGMEAAARAYYEALDSIVLPRKDRICGIAFSTPGRIGDDGMCITSGNLGYLTGHNLVPYCRETYGLPAAVENDGKCAALAELWKGSLADVKNGLIFAFGTGIGGGIIINGELYRGSHFAAGEISNVAYDVDRMTEKGGRITDHVTAPALCELFGEDSGEAVFARVEAGEPEALELLDRFAWKVAGSMASIQAVLDVDRIAIGGGISRRPELLEAIRSHIKEVVDPDIFIPLGGSPVQVPEIVTCRFFNEANLIGALYSLLKKEGNIE